MITHRTISRRSILRAAGTATALCATPAWAQRAAIWPDRPVRLIVPYPAGGSTDVLFRILAERLQDKLGQPFVVENRPGASGNVGIDAVAKSTPDGYMIGRATVGHFSINQFLIAKMPYDAEKDLVAPSLTYELPNFAVVAAQHVPAKTLAELIEWAKARSNGIAIGSPDLAPRHTSQEFSSRRAPVSMPFMCPPGGGANHSGDAGWRCDLRSRQPRLVHFADRGRDNARSCGDLGAALANIAECANHGGSGRTEFRRDLLGSLRHAKCDPPAVVDKLSTTQKEIAAESRCRSVF